MKQLRRVLTAIAFGALAFSLATATAVVAFGHGIPVIVDVSAGKLTVSNGIVDPAGYAPMIFADSSTDALMDHTFVPGFGNVALINLPGFNIFDMTPGSGLNLQVVPRPVKGTSPVEQRLLWHWSLGRKEQELDPIAVDPLGESLIVASSFGQISIPQIATPVPAALRVADPTAAQIGAHVEYLRYLLDDNPTADVGAYGFFARLTSQNFASSDPFFMVFNDDLDSVDLLTAASAINAAAVLTGDFNHDDRVDAADYTAWRDTLGSTTQLAADASGNQLVDVADYNIWRNNFNSPAGGGGLSNVRTAEVPEPTSKLLLLAAVGSWILSVGVRRTRRLPTISAEDRGRVC
jgi:hypothetical protein